MSYKNVFTDIYENYGFGSKESRSGPGSTLEETRLLREKIKTLVQEKNIKSVVDIPCGDFHWMKEIVFSFESYIGGDIVEKAVAENNEKYGNSRIKFINFDLVNDNIPEADLLLVRDIIGHFPLEDGKKIVQNILKSNCKYLLSTTWAKKTEYGWTNCGPNDIDRENEGVDFGRFYPVNLMASPFNFPNPELCLEEDVRVDNWDNGNRKVLALWDLSKVKEFIKSNNNLNSNTNTLNTLLSQVDTLSKEEKENLIKYLSTPQSKVNNKVFNVMTKISTWSIYIPKTSNYS